MLSQDRSPFISSCTRRELNRRRGGRTLLRTQVLVAVIVLAGALGAFVAARGGL